ncbi:rCG20924, partial [Rattus norvegicus]
MSCHSLLSGERER